MDSRAQALAKERARLEDVRRRRAERDAQRLADTAAAAEEAQRAPLLERFHSALRHLVAAQKEAEATRLQGEAEGARWRATGLSTEAAALWRDAGVSGEAASNMLNRLAVEPELAQAFGAGPDVLLGQLATTRLSGLDFVDLVDALGLLGLRLPESSVADDVEQFASAILDPRGVRELLGQIEESAWDDWVVAEALTFDARLPPLTHELLHGLDARVLDALIARDPAALLEALEGDSLGDYVLARVRPEALSDQQVEGLGWERERARRGVMAMHVDSPELEVDAELSALHELLRLQNIESALTRLAHGSPVAADLLRLKANEEVPTQRCLEDTSVWYLLEHMMSAVGPNKATVLEKFDKRSPFLRFFVLRRARAALYQGADAEALVWSAWGVRNFAPKSHELFECRNIAIAAQWHAGHYDVARDLAVKLAKLGGSPEVCKQNAEIVARRHEGEPLSPYLVLGCDSADPGAEELAYLQYKQVWNTDRDLAMAVNWARQELRQAESTKRFVLPLRPVLYRPVPQSSGLLRPPATPMAPRTSSIDLDYLAVLRDEAADLLAQRVKNFLNLQLEGVPA